MASKRKNKLLSAKLFTRRKNYLKLTSIKVNMKINLVTNKNLSVNNRLALSKRLSQKAHTNPCCKPKEKITFQLSQILLTWKTWDTMENSGSEAHHKRWMLSLIPDLPWHGCSLRNARLHCAQKRMLSIINQNLKTIISF